MAKSSNYWDKRAIKRLNEAEQISEAHIERIKRIYNQAYRDIDGEIARVYKNYSKETGLDVQKLKELLTKKETDKVWKTLQRQGLDKYIKNNYKSRISRLEQIQAQIYAKAKLIYPKEELEQTMCYNGVINNSYYKAVYDTQMGTGYDFSFNKIDKNLTTALLNEKWSGLNYSQRIWGNTDILADSLSQILGGAMLSGQSIEKTSKQIRDRFNVSKYYAERLVRTETNHFNNEADAMAYEEMGINKYVFVATLDSRTSETCQNHDGKVYDYKDKEVGVNFPPLHPNCRSKTRGYLGKEAEKTLKRRARNPQTGKTELVDNIPYNEWIRQYETNNTVETNTLKGREEKAKALQDILMDINENRRVAFGLNLATKEELINSPFKDITFSVDIENMDDRFIDSLIDNYKELGNEYYSSLSHIGTFSKEDMLTRPNSLGYSFTNGTTLTGEIHFNQKSMKDFDNYIDIIENCSKIKHISPNINPKNYKYYASTHEFAHTIYHESMLNKNLIGMDTKIYKNFDKELEIMYNNYKTKIDSLNKQIKELNTKFVLDTENYTKADGELLKALKKEYDETFVSNYAVRDNEKLEFMAECFAEAKLSDKPSKTSLDMLSVIDKYFKR